MSRLDLDDLDSNKKKNKNNNVVLVLFIILFKTYILLLIMCKPVNKKSGFEFRRERDRKIKAQEEVVRKTVKIHAFFEITKMTDETRSNETEDEQCNNILPSNINHFENERDSEFISSMQADTAVNQVESIPDTENGNN